MLQLPPHWLLLTCLCITASSCRVRSREFLFSLGNKPITSERSASAAFELRHGAFAAIPTDVINEVNQDVMSFLKANGTIQGKPNTAKTNAPGGQTETHVGASEIVLCTTGFKISPGEGQDPSLLVELQTCGLQVTVLDSYAAMRFTGDLESKPAKISIARLTLNDQSKARTARLKVLPAFNRRGELFINDLEILSGFELLADPRQYTMAVNQSGFEENSGYVGDKVHALRQRLVESVMGGVRGFTEASLKNVVVRALTRSVNKINRTRIAQGGWHFNIDIERFLVIGRMLPRSIVSGKAGLGISSQIDTSLGLKDQALPLPCRVRHKVIPSAEPVSDFGFSRNFEFIPSLPGGDPRIRRAQLLVPESFLNYQLWQLFGDEGECVLNVSLPEQVTGKITLTYREPLKVALDVPNDRFKSKDGVMMTTRFPGVHLVLSKELVAALEKRGVKIQANVSGQAEYEMNDFRHAMLLKVNQGDATIVPHPAVEVLYEAGMRDGVNDFFETLIAQANGLVITGASSSDVLRKWQSMLHGAIDFVLKQTVKPGSFAIKLGGGGRIWIESMAADRQTLKMIVAVDDLGTVTNIANEFQLAEKSAADAATSLSVLQLGKLVPALQILPAEFQKRLVNGEFTEAGWQCAIPATQPTGLPFGETRISFVNYATCQRQGAGLLEFRWQYDGAVGKDPSVATSQLQYIRARIVRPASASAGFDIWAANSVLGKTTERLVSPNTSRIFWERPEAFISLSGFCSGSAKCEQDALSAKFFDLELFRK